MLKHPSNNLPVPLTSFIGREREIIEIKRLLATTRCLTLMGPGGCGKTRLALRVADELAESYADGVGWVELASLADPALVPQRVATALGVRESGNRPLIELLCDHLLSRRMLLVLDNCEHLVAACAHLAETLLRACPNLQLLTTSREALGSPAEVTWLAPSLTLPVPSSLPTVEELNQYEAIRLFVERAAAVQPGFMLTPQNAPAVGQVCRRLDGIPLAIELAAARMRVLAVEQIAVRLDNCFQLLAAGSRTALPRHQTLRATIDWSYALLAEQEVRLFRRLSVFAGGWTLEAAEATCADDDLARNDILDLLSHLIDKSLVVMQAQENQARYHLLETVRQYGAEKLLETNESEALRRRHTDFFLRLAEEIEPKINSGDRATWLALLEADHDNLRAALLWAVEAREEGLGLRLAGAVWWFWFHRGYWSEGRDWLKRVLVLSGDAEAPILTGARAKALYGAGWLAFTQGDPAAARSQLEESVAVWRLVGDTAGLAYSLAQFALVIAHQGEPVLALPIATESVQRFRKIENHWGLALALTNMGISAETLADYSLANTLFEESAALFKSLGDGWALSLPLRHLGIVAARQGDYGRAATLYKESLIQCRDLGEKWLISLCLEELALVACMQGEYGRAVRLLGADENLREAIGAGIRALYRADYNQAVTTARTQMGEEAFATAWAEGQAMTLAQAIDEAQQVMAPEQIVEPQPPALASPSPAALAGLTPREVEVLRLVAQGFTNAQVAERLVITPRTVNVHLTSIYSKLQVTSRTAATRYAIEHSLI